MTRHWRTPFTLIMFTLRSITAFQSLSLPAATGDRLVSSSGDRLLVQRNGHFRSSSLATSVVLHAKFKLDNDMDWEDNGRNENSSSSASFQKIGIPSRLQEGDEDDDDDWAFENLKRNALPTTTFGSEAVPMEQRPANEYLNLLSAPFFDWANRPSGNVALGVRLGGLYTVLFGAVCWPISGATFTADGYLFHKILSSHIGALGFILIFCLRLYSGWGYVGGRLTSKEIEFEETGWYDGDVEMKTEAEIARDLLLYRQDVKPVVERMKSVCLGVGVVWIVSCIGLNVLFHNKPLFDEYDPDLLERLVYDDKVAGIAAEQSNGIPTYCNSRYYRAVANGGQGCK